MNTTLPQDSKLRKEYPLYEGCFRYFPAALAGVARHSKAGNDKHNPGEEMHHARNKSTDHESCILRHLMDLADMLTRNQHAQDCKAILDEANALAWRALALSQKLHEQIGGAPLAPGAKISEPTPAISIPVDVDVSQLKPGAVIRVHDPLLPGLEKLRAAGDRFGAQAKAIMEEEAFRAPPLEGYPNPRCSKCQQDPCACIGLG